MLPAHTGEVPPAVGVAGIGFTTTVVEPDVVLVQPKTVTVTLYTPAFAAAAEAIVGFCDEAVYDPGPVQLKVPPATLLAIRFSGEPAQTGELLEAEGAAGNGFTETLTVPGEEGHPASVTTRLYVPDLAPVTPATLGVAEVEEKDPGPVHA